MIWFGRKKEPERFEVDPVTLAISVFRQNLIEADKERYFAGGEPNYCSADLLRGNFTAFDFQREHSRPIYFEVEQIEYRDFPAMSDGQ